MFDPVTDEALRLRRMSTGPGTSPVPSGRRSSLVCSVCDREIRAEERIFWVANEPHCYQCHGMLEFEYDRERQVDREQREKGTRWRREDR